MLFWFAILVGVIFAMVGIRKSLYPMWAILFGVLISVYLSIILAPTIIEMIGKSENSHYNHAACVAAVAVGVFVVLHTFAVFTLTGTFSVSFPIALSNIVAGAAGFISGFVVVSFAVLLISITPLSRHESIAKFLGQPADPDSKTVFVKSIEKTCRFVASASMQANAEETDNIIQWLTQPGYDQKYHPNETAE